jgi:Flp pilus assembly pilin Flp
MTGPRSRVHRFLQDAAGLATVEYVVGAAIALGTLATGISAWNNGLVARLEALVTQIQGVQ